MDFEQDWDGREELEVAEELEGVAETLLGVDQETGVGWEGFTLPLGLGKAAGMGVNFAKLPADFVVLPAFGEVAGAELGEGEVVADAGVVGVSGEGGLVGFQGCFDEALAKQGVAAVGGCGFVALEFGLVEGFDGLVDEARFVGAGPTCQGVQGRGLGFRVGRWKAYLRA